MAKPNPTPVVKGNDAKALIESLKKPHPTLSNRRLFRGAMAEYTASES